MADRVEIPGFIGGSYPERAIGFDSERSINLYPVVGSPTTRSQMMLVNTPGLEFILNVGSGPIRGIQRTQNYWYVVCGNSVYQIDAALTVIQATGTLATNGGKVGLSYNNNKQLAIVDGQNLYICTTESVSPALSTITTNILGNPTSVCFINNYFIISLLNTQKFQWSANNDGTTWSATDTNFASNSSNNLVAVAASNGYVYMLGTDQVEVWSNNPSQITIGAVTISFPFNYTGTIIPYGLAGALTVINIENGLAWLTSTNLTSPHIVFTQGSQGAIISTPAMEQLIASFGNYSNAFCMASHQQGQETLIISFPSAPATICYDFRTQLFHERSSYNGQMWLPIDVEAFGENVEIAGDSTTGNLYYLMSNVYTDNGQPIVKQRICPHNANMNEQMTVYRIEVLFEQGVGLPSGQGSKPIASIECSTDYGHTYNFKRNEFMGEMGEYNKRVYWNRFGVGRDFVIRLTISDPVPVKIIKAWSEFEIGEH